MSTKFTPGPWHIDTEPTSGWPITRTGKHYISSAPMRGERYGDEMADLNLIAAAPEMYAALERAVAILKAWDSDDVVSDDTLMEMTEVVIPQCRAALAKADGGAR